MRLFTTLGGALCATVVLTVPVSAQPKPRAAPKATARPAATLPKPIGTFEDWRAATHSEAGQTVCYAFTRAQSSVPIMPGRGDVVLTVTQRPSGRDAVAISAGFTYAANAEVIVTADKTELPFYTGGRSAFARDGHGAALAFDRARTAVAKSPGPKQAAVSDSFSLRGFTAAYAAVNKACPAQ